MHNSARLFLYTEVMTNDFSQQLTQDAVAYFSELYGRQVSAEEAESFLRSLSQLIDCFLNPEN